MVHDLDTGSLKYLTKKDSPKEYGDFMERELAHR